MNKKALLSIIISIALVWYLLAQIEAGAIIKTLKDVPPGLVFLGFAFYALSYLFRALRFKVLLQKEISLATLFNIVSVHNMWTNLLPFRAGELSYLYLLKKRGGVESYVTGVPSLILSRVFDIMAISFLFLCSFIGIKSLSKELRVMGLVLISFVFCVLAIMMFLIWKKERFLAKIKQYILRLNLDKFIIVQGILGRGKEVIEGFEAAKGKHVTIVSFIFSVLIWVSINAVNFILIMAVGIEMTIWQVVFLSTFFILFSFLPVNGYAGFGTTEALWVLMVGNFGIPTETAISTGFATHILSLVIFVIIGTIGSVAFIKSPTSSPKKRNTRVIEV